MLACRMIRAWIDGTLRAHANEARTVASVIEACEFRRLPDYFDPSFLARVKCVTIERVPLPRPAEIGLKLFAGYGSKRYVGITYRDTYFVSRRFARQESLHFHELVHAVQWDCLGTERFLAAYAEGFLRRGYARSPLEIMAYDLQYRFETDPAPYAVETLVREVLRDWA